MECDSNTLESQLPHSFRSCWTIAALRDLKSRSKHDDIFYSILSANSTALRYAVRYRRFMGFPDNSQSSSYSASPLRPNKSSKQYTPKAARRFFVATPTFGAFRTSVTFRIFFLRIRTKITKSQISRFRLSFYRIITYNQYMTGKGKVESRAVCIPERRAAALFAFGGLPWTNLKK